MGNAIRACRICGASFEPKPHQIKRHDFACLPCRAKAQREYAKPRRGAVNRSQYKYESRNRVKIRAKHRLRMAIARGEISPLPCCVCGEKAEAHHAAYSLPLGVTWLCKQHHEEVHHASYS